MAVNLREHVVGTLKPLLPARWNLKAANDLTDDIDRPTVVLVFQKWERSTIAPATQRVATFVLTILEPKTNPGPADDALDDDLAELLTAIETAGQELGMTWTTAERGVSHSKPGFDITIVYPFDLDQPLQTPQEN